MVAPLAELWVAFTSASELASVDVVFTAVPVALLSTGSPANVTE